MTVTRERRVKLKRLSEATRESEGRETWAVDSLIPMSGVEIYAAAGAGKSYFIDSIAFSIALAESHWNGFPINLPTERRAVFVAATDIGEEHTRPRDRWVIDAGIETDEIGVASWPAEGMPEGSDWENLRDDLVDAGAGMFVLDNKASALPWGMTTNDKGILATYARGMALLADAGVVPVLVSHHSDAWIPGVPMDKRGPSGGIETKQMFRHLIQVSRPAENVMRATVHKSNMSKAGQSWSFRFHPGEGLGRNYLMRDDEAGRCTDEAKASKQAERDATASNKDRELADHVVAECQGMSVRAVADYLHDKHLPTATVETIRGWHRRGNRVFAHVSRADDGTWTRTSRPQSAPPDGALESPLGQHREAVPA